MTILADPPEPLMGEVPISRVRAGETKAEPIWVTWAPAFGVLPPMLAIATGWDGERFGQWDHYTAVAIHHEGDVCRVRLARDPEKVRAIPPGGDRSAEYEVSIGPRSGWCACRGYSMGNDERRACKHVAALAWVSGNGQLNERTVGDEPEREAGDGGGCREAGPDEAGDGRQED